MRVRTAAIALLALLAWTSPAAAGPDLWPDFHAFGLTKDLLRKGRLGSRHRAVLQQVDSRLVWDAAFLARNGEIFAAEAGELSPAPAGCDAIALYAETARDSRREPAGFQRLDRPVEDIGPLPVSVSQVVERFSEFRLPRPRRAAFADVADCDRLREHCWDRWKGRPNTYAEIQSMTLGTGGGLVPCDFADEAVADCRARVEAMDPKERGRLAALARLQCHAAVVPVAEPRQGGVEIHVVGFDGTPWAQASVSAPARRTSFLVYVLTPFTAVADAFLLLLKLAAFAAMLLIGVLLSPF